MKKILFFILLIPMLAFPQTEGAKWNYPVKPGTDAWKSLQNNSEKVQVCQVPNEILTAMSTQELIHICLNYPLLPDIFCF